MKLNNIQNIQNPAEHGPEQPAIANHALSRELGLDNLKRLFAPLIIM